MAAAYDTYDYPAYWEGREYEHASEEIALNRLLNNIPKIRTILDVGAGYGRLTQVYNYRAKKVIITDPSAKYLKLARENVKGKNVTFIQSKLENLPGKVKSRSIDLIVVIRVLHHVDDLDCCFESLNKVLSKNGYIILEFANKDHFKAVFSEFIKGNFTFPIDIFPKDLRSNKSKKDKCIPFLNYHPDDIENKLLNNNFQIVEKLSVSNCRSSFLKRLLPFEVLLSFEKMLQKPFSFTKFGPSIFILAKKSS